MLPHYRGVIFLICIVLICVFSPTYVAFRVDYRRPFLPFPAITNVSLVVDSFLELMRNAVEGQRRANATLILPWIDFFVKLLTSNSSQLPTVLPHQTAPLPSLRTDIYCNTGLFPNGCTNLDELGKMIGIPAADWFQASRISSTQHLVAHVLGDLYTQIAMGITPTFVSFIQGQEFINGTISSVKNLMHPFTTLPSETPLWKAVTNITALAVWDVFLNKMDIEDDVRKHVFHMKRQTRSAILCSLFKERLPICKNLTEPVISESEIPIPEEPVDLSKEIDVKTGFRLEIEITGFQASCIYAPAQCEISGFGSNPEQFDGRYKLMGTDDLGYPLYQKTNVKFSNFQAIKSLWLFIVGFIGPIFPQGITAAIMPNQPTYIGTALESSIPFAIYAGVPPSCVTTASFPLCLESTEKPSYLEEDYLTLSQRGTETDDRELTGWLLARSSSLTCVVSVDRNNGLCEIPVFVSIL